MESENYRIARELVESFNDECHSALSPAEQLSLIRDIEKALDEKDEKALDARYEKMPAKWEARHAVATTSPAEETT